MNNIPFTKTFTRFVHVPGSDFSDVVCDHEDDCATGMHGACVHILKQRREYGRTFEQTYYDAGMTFVPTDVVSISLGPFEPSEGEDPNDYARIGYWWGNSNLYWPITLQEWLAALEAVKNDHSI